MEKNVHSWAIQNQVVGHCLPTPDLHEIWIHPHGYVIIRLSPFRLRKVDRKLNAPGAHEGGEAMATENEERD